MKKLTVLFTFIALLSSNSVMALTAQEQKIAHEVIEACQTLDKCTKALIDEKLKNAKLQANKKSSTNNKKSTAKKSTKKGKKVVCNPIACWYE